ncbi:ParB/RepB/Spo0J family partition protein [Aliiroseovarius lamellibrachiae]|uniref:ParB/RepB/Spo0J family partition protein n=1 Tax=Aliiroseovarius lamellibrachiae TaxID=1924933 RepID=UPI001BDFA287|nr:ParB/RepB/Spo0J family partition protein [Aliiroseovarius lamellibrachiae]MBT2132452.1 ParB/RepB/Spo0J family partition protein [Aliiroseovarius lamellibrachiae]
MARRRKLEAPSAEDMNRLEQEFRSETPMRNAMAPIAQVAADAAMQSPVVTTEAREQMAKDTADAEVLRDALGKGLVMAEVPLDQIDLDDMIRDRVTLDRSELEELKVSIQANGLRLPVELYVLKAAEGGVKYGVVSGYRRIMAIKTLKEETGEVGFSTVKALIKPIETIPDAFVAMVEENEIRSQLSHFERGRIAVISTQNGAFASVEEAVAKLFSSASKAKRSKVRSFAQVFEELGDMLKYAESLTEKQGLRLAAGLRMGGVQELREALATQAAIDAAGEWLAVLPVLEAFEEGPKDNSRGGRPRAASNSERTGAHFELTRAGKSISVHHAEDKRGHLVRFEGGPVDRMFMEEVLAGLQRLLKD